MEFLEERWPESALLSVDPFGRASAREIEEICDTHYEAVNWVLAKSTGSAAPLAHWPSNSKMLRHNTLQSCNLGSLIDW